MRRAARIGLQVASFGAVVYLIVREWHTFRGFGHELSGLRWWWVVVALVTELASIPALAEEQRIILRCAGVDVGRVRMNLLTLASNAIASSVPAGVAIAEGYAYAKYEDFGAKGARAAWTELASGSIAFAALAGLAMAGAAMATGLAQHVLVPTVAVVLAGALGASALFRRPPLIVKAAEFLSRRFGSWIARWTDKLDVQELADVHPSPAVWGTAFGLSGANWLLDAACLAASFSAVHARVPWSIVLLAFAGTKVVSSIGITPGGLGIVEGGLVGVFVAYGVHGPVAAAAVITYRAVTFGGLIALGWVAVAVLHQDRFRKPAPASG